MFKISATIEKQITVNHNEWTWFVLVYGKQIDFTLQKMPAIEKILTTTDQFEQLVQHVKAANICVGNSDEKFSKLSAEKHSAFIHELTTNCKTIRHKHCAMLLEKGDRCLSCQALRSSLRCELHKLRQNASSPNRLSASSKVPLNCMSKSDVITRYKDLKRKRNCDLQKISSLKAKIAKLNDVSCDVDDSLDREIHSLTANANKNENMSPLAQLFIDEQVKASSRSKNGRRWHPLIIRWALGLKHKSSSAYRYLQKSKFLVLPSESTLDDYTHYRESVVGVDVEGLKSLHSLHPQGADVALLADEMKLQDGIVYHNGKIIGYQELGSLNKAMESAVNDKVTSNIATHALAYLIQGVKQRLLFPVAVFATKSADASTLYNTFWECVRQPELAGFRVRTFVCDGAASNRRFFKLHKGDFPDDAIAHRCINKFSTEDRCIYFISDVPHLIKTTRNCWENSGSHLKSRNLIVSIC